MEEEEVAMLRSEQEQEIEMTLVSKANHLISVAPHLSCDSVCTFFNKADNASDSEERSKSMKKLCALIVFYLVAMLVEIVGGVKANSLAVMTDAAHLLTDIAGLSISLFTVWASGWEATSHHSFGFNRLEVLGALLSVQLIWLISGFLIYEACQRILQKYAKVDGKLMFGVAAFGFFINLIMVVFLGHDHAHHHGHGHDHHIDHGHGRHHNHHHGHDHDHHSHGHDHHEDDETNLIPSSPVRTKILNINLQGAYLHMLTDLIQSVGVMIAGSIMWKKPHWYVVDLLCTFIFSTFALTTTVPMLRNVFGILMEKTPSEINIDRLRSDLKGIKGVQTVHDLHIWAITVGKIVMSCHVIAEPGVSSSEILYKIRDHCQTTHRIHHVTVQIE